MMKTFKQFILEFAATAEGPADVDETLAQAKQALDFPENYLHDIPDILDDLGAAANQIASEPRRMSSTDMAQGNDEKYSIRMREIRDKWKMLSNKYKQLSEDSVDEELNYETAYLVKETKKLLIDCQANGLFSKNRPSRRSLRRRR